MNHKKTIVIGASPNPKRYSYKAVTLLSHFGYELIALGIRSGNINGIEIIKGRTHFDDIHTVTLYLGPDRQIDYYDYILSLKPKRIIFNPGTENLELYNLAMTNNIEVIEHCTLVMLNSGTY
ncbi:MAG: CoA-binding protein [Bacteroidota bacterium]